MCLPFGSVLLFCWHLFSIIWISYVHRLDILCNWSILCHLQWISKVLDHETQLWYFWRKKSGFPWKKCSTENPIILWFSQTSTTHRCSAYLLASTINHSFNTICATPRFLSVLEYVWVCPLLFSDPWLDFSSTHTHTHTHLLSILW